MGVEVNGTRRHRLWVHVDEVAFYWVDERHCEASCLCQPTNWPHELTAPSSPRQATALPNTIHVTEVVHNRVRAAGGESFMPYTTSQVQVRHPSSPRPCVSIA